MGNDALIAALLRAADYINNDGSTLSATATANVIETLRDHAATLRQQAFSQFANPEALADWLDALHECHADGSVGNRKWEAAQVAARAIRSLNEPSGNSGQLRQQAGRVDEGMVARFKTSFHGPESEGDYDTRLAAALTAALAQNTQGEASFWITRADLNRANSQGDNVVACPAVGDAPADAVLLYPHAERARVPELARALVETIDNECEHVTSDAVWAAKERLQGQLAAAPSQREVVKSVPQGQSVITESYSIGLSDWSKSNPSEVK